MRAKIIGAFAVGFLTVVIASFALMRLVLAQAPTTVELETPETLMSALDLDICSSYLLAKASLQSEETDADTAGVADIAPENAEHRSILVFNLASLERADLTAVLRFDSKDAVLAKVSNIPLVELNSLSDAGAADSSAPLYGWMAVYYDAQGKTLCRTTAYPGLSDGQNGMALVSLQGFIAQMSAANRLLAANYQPDERCAFDTPQFCDTIFMGDASDERIEGTTGSDQINAAAGNDTVNANAGDDYVDGGDGDDVIDGGGGDDVIIGGGGGDSIHGGDGDDVIRGGDGDDIIRGDQGVDTLSGDAGVDTVEQ